MNRGRNTSLAIGRLMNVENQIRFIVEQDQVITGMSELLIFDRPVDTWGPDRVDRPGSPW